MVIQHNLSAMFTDRQLGITTNNKAKSSEKLSSGYRINRAADDAAGLAISEKMRRLIRGLGQNMDNIQDGISFCQVADGYLNEVHEMIQRINELAVKGATDTLTNDDRNYINMEVQDTKDEIQRIFDVASFNEMYIFRLPYTPSVTPAPEPNDMQVWYSAPNTIGGLEFNNVRYTISELQNAGVPIDNNGIATTTGTVEFNLQHYNNELVSLNLVQGSSLANVTRNYYWTADNTGINVNNVPAATWGALGIAGNGSDSGTYGFNYHGMRVDFSVENGDTLADIIAGINGNGITSASYWSIGASSTTTRPVVQYPTTQTITVTNANANNVTDDFVLNATTSGLSITDTTTGNTSSVSAWSGFSHTGAPLDSDTTGSGYPIREWGISDNNNDASEITFDTEAVYGYSGTVDNVNFNFTFQLADVSSRAEVLAAMNGTAVEGAISCPATLTNSGTATGTTTTDGSRLTVSNMGIENNYELQRAYGRNFDTNADMTGQITWTSTFLNETDHSTPVSTNTYSTGSSTTTTGPNEYYVRDANGNYYRYDETTTTTVSQMQSDKVYQWQRNYAVTYDGTLGTSDMQDATENVSINYTQVDSETYSRTQTHYSYTNQYMLSADEVTQLLAQEARGEVSINTKMHLDSDYNSAVTTTSTTTVEDGTLVHTQNYIDENETDSSNYAFTFRHSISYAQIATGGSGQSNLNLHFDGAATMNFQLRASSNSVVEYDFNDITIHPPQKQLIVQATPESPVSEQIPLVWSAMNLAVIGMAGTNTLTASAAKAAIDQAKAAIKKVSEERGKFGASQNRMEHAYKNVANTRENTQAAESIIRDTDMAAEYMKFACHNILEQAGQSMLAQANQSNQGVMQLLQ